MEQLINPSVDIDPELRQFNVGSLISANFPYQWDASIRNSTLMLLVKWCVETELHMYTSAASMDEYFANAEMTALGAFLVENEFKKEFNAMGILPPHDPAFPICQYMCREMQLTKTTGELSRLLLSCGMLGLATPQMKNPVYVFEQTRRLVVICRLLLSVFPDPYPGPIQDYTEVLTFGVNLERQLYLRAKNTRHYMESIDNMNEQLRRFRRAEYGYLENDLRLMKRFLAPAELEFIRNPPPPNVNMNNNNDEEEEEEEEGDEDDEDEEENDM